MLSWAVKGQGGHGHVNEQDNDYIIDQMERRGFRIDVALSNLMRTSLPLARDGTWWLMHTLMVFWREQ